MKLSELGGLEGDGREKKPYKGKFKVIFGGKKKTLQKKKNKKK
mgnify:CR=1 FL=1